MEGLPSLTDVIRASGPLGAIIAGLVVGTIGAIILIARSRSLFAGSATEVQATGFQERLLGLVDKLTASEARLREDMERLRTESDEAEERMGRLQVEVTLLRNQLRRYIDLLKAVREGRVAPNAIDPALIGEEAPT